jgi:hypothetical protein
MKIQSFTRRTAAVLCVAALPLLFAPLGCKREKKAPVQATVEEPARMASTVHAADPKTASQLVSGFYDVEQNAWRWAQKKFSVILRPPVGAAQRGATLTLKFAVPDVVFAKLKDLSVTATVNGSALPPQTFTKAGEFTYSREVAPNLLTGDSVRVDFALDKAIAPSGNDARELGVVFLSAGLELK